LGTTQPMPGHAAPAVQPASAMSASGIDALSRATTEPMPEHHLPDDAKTTLPLPSRELRNAALAEAARRAGLDSPPSARAAKPPLTAARAVLFFLAVAVLAFVLYWALRTIAP